MADLKNELDKLFAAKKAADEKEAVKAEEARDVVAEFLRTVVSPAFDEFKEQIEAHGRSVDLTQTNRKARLTVKHDGKLEYGIEAYSDAPGSTAIATRVHLVDWSNGRPYAFVGALWTAEVTKKDDVINYILSEYKKAFRT